MSLTDVVVSTAYKTGGSVLNVNGLSLILPALNIVPNQITVYQASTYGTSTQISGVYSITRASGSVIAGLSLTSGVDGPWVPGDFVVLQINAPVGAGSGTVTSVSAGTGLSGGPITGAGTLQVANSTVNTLAGYNASGVFSTVTVSTGLSFVGGVLTATGGGGSGIINPGSSGQVAVYSASMTLGGVNQSSIQIVASNIIGTIAAASLGSGTANSNTFLSGNQTYTAPFIITTTGTTGAATFSSGVLNVPQYAGAVSSLTTTGTSGASTLSGGVLNVPNYATGGGSASITSTNTNLTVSPSPITGTGTITVPTTGLTLTQFSGAIVNVTQSSGTVTFDLSQSNRQTCTLTANATVALSNPTTGQTFTLIFTQAATGGPYTLTLFSGITWMGASGPPSMPTTASAVLEVLFECIGTGVYLGHYLGVSGVSSGSAGGSTGQLQVNSGGNFAGVPTVAGDGTLNTTTGALVITQTNGVAFAASATTNTVNASNITSGTLAAAQLPTTGVLPTSLTGTGVIPAGAMPALTGAVVNTAGSLATTLATVSTLNLLANTTGGTAAPAGVTLSAALDAMLGATQNNIPVRGASVWAPNSNLVLPTATRYGGGTKYRLTTPGTAVTATGATSLLTSAVGTGSLILAANEVLLGQRISMFFGGTLTNTSTSAVITLTVLLGGTTIFTCATASFGTNSSSGQLWSTNYGGINFLVSNITSSGKIFCGNAQVAYGYSVPGYVTATGGPPSAVPITIDFTSAKTFDVQVNVTGTFSALSIVMNTLVIEVCG